MVVLLDLWLSLILFIFNRRWIAFKLLPIIPRWISPCRIHIFQACHYLCLILMCRTKAPISRDFWAVSCVVFYLEQPKLESLTFCNHVLSFKFLLLSLNTTMRIPNLILGLVLVLVVFLVVCNCGFVYGCWFFYCFSRSLSNKIAWVQSLLYEMDIALTKTWYPISR